MRKILFVMIFAAFTFPGLAETKHMGNYSYVNTDGVINLGLNAAVARKCLNNDYIPFRLYAACDEGQKATMNRQSVTMIYNGKEYSVPTLKAFRSAYKQDIKDNRMFRILTEHIMTSELHKHSFQKNVNFFPARNERVTATEEASMTYLIGARTTLYFENPGLKLGDTIIIRVKDVDNNEITGEIEITL